MRGVYGLFGGPGSALPAPERNRHGHRNYPQQAEYGRTSNQVKRQPHRYERPSERSNFFPGNFQHQRQKCWRTSDSVNRRYPCYEKGPARHENARDAHITSPDHYQHMAWHSGDSFVRTSSCLNQTSRRYQEWSPHPGRNRHDASDMPSIPRMVTTHENARDAHITSPDHYQHMAWNSGDSFVRTSNRLNRKSRRYQELSPHPGRNRHDASDPSFSEKFDVCRNHSPKIGFEDLWTPAKRSFDPDFSENTDGFKGPYPKRLAIRDVGNYDILSEEEKNPAGPRFRCDVHSDVERHARFLAAVEVPEEPVRLKFPVPAAAPHNRSAPAVVGRKSWHPIIKHPQSAVDRTPWKPAGGGPQIATAPRCRCGLVSVPGSSTAGVFFVCPMRGCDFFQWSGAHIGQDPMQRKTEGQNNVTKPRRFTTLNHDLREGLPRRAYRVLVSTSKCGRKDVFEEGALLVSNNDFASALSLQSGARVASMRTPRGRWRDLQGGEHLSDIGVTVIIDCMVREGDLLSGVAFAQPCTLAVPEASLLPEPANLAAEPSGVPNVKPKPKPQNFSVTVTVDDFDGRCIFPKLEEVARNAHFDLNESTMSQLTVVDAQENQRRLAEFLEDAPVTRGMFPLEVTYTTHKENKHSPKAVKPVAAGRSEKRRKKRKLQMLHRRYFLLFGVPPPKGPKRGSDPAWLLRQLKEKSATETATMHEQENHQLAMAADEVKPIVPVPASAHAPVFSTARPNGITMIPTPTLALPPAPVPATVPVTASGPSFGHPTENVPPPNFAIPVSTCGDAGSSTSFVWSRYS